MIQRELKSSETLRRYLEGVETFTEFMNVACPDEALNQLRAMDDVTKTVDDYISFLIKKGFSPVNLKAHFFGVKKWLGANRVNGVDWAYLSRPKVSTQIMDRIPSKSELRIILQNKISLRDKAFFMVALSSGLRIGTLANLQVKDYKPVEDLGMINVQGGPNRKLAEGKHYFTFITPETREVLEEYLKTRTPKPTDMLFTKTTGEPLSPFVTNISRQWRAIIKRSNLAKKIDGHSYSELHAHVLRKFFQTTCKLAGCRADFVDFWMGHHPARADQYLNDSYFRPEIKDHVSEYRKAEKALTIFKEYAPQDLADLRTENEAMRKEMEKLKQTSEIYYKTITEDLMKLKHKNDFYSEYEPRTDADGMIWIDASKLSKREMTDLKRFIDKLKKEKE